MSNKHEGKVAVVTGSATGIGQAYAKRLAEDGANIAIAEHISSSSETEALVRAAGREVLSRSLLSYRGCRMTPSLKEQDLGNTSR